MSKRQIAKRSARKVFAERMREARLRIGISQESLADLAGLHRTYIGSVERAERNVSIDNMARIAMALRRSLKDLLSEDGA